jgi:hypothetical protein
MRSMMKSLGIGVAAALMVAGLSVRAQAAPIVYVSPVAQTINISNITEFQVDILVEGLTEEIGGYDFTLEFDESIIDVVSSLADPDDNFSNEDEFDDFGAGFFSWFVAGDPANDNDGTTDPLRIATFTFQALNVGNSALNLTFAALSNADGTADIADVTSRDGLVCVARLGSEGPDEPVLNDPGCTVPEPTMLSLLAAGLATAVVRRRKRS